MKRLTLFLLVVSISVFVHCGDEDTRFTQSTLSINFNHLVNGNDLQLDQLIYQNELGQSFSIKTVKYFVSKFTFHHTTDGPIQMPDIHYIDIRNPESLNYTFENKIPIGDYSGVSFVYGIVQEENLTGKFTDPPESLMEWPEPMGGGYHYMKLEGEFKISNTESFFNFHSGMLGGTPYEIHIDLPNSGFTTEENQLNLALNMEILNWFKNPKNWDFEYFGPAIMGNPEAQKTIQENGQDVFSIQIGNELQ